MIKLYILFDLHILTTNFTKVYDNIKKDKMHYIQKMSTMLDFFLKKNENKAGHIGSHLFQPTKSWRRCTLIIY